MSKNNTQLIMSLVPTLSSLEKVTIAQMVLNAAFKEGLEFPLDVEEPAIRTAFNSLNRALDNYKKTVNN